ncbi:hypothetical protein FOCG_18283 [Fusarium oxysporum f. sp. radicis-lycopersici 26381]|nr:hypothetical protein FOWG_17656 [Fusarium oxysporum f. sp. lycopersici MN25]EXL39097.1 hypothetical protein FOCG_18283 [Fusarium oxysporum f. sp. radicis-lycopersici 26381]
MLVAYPRWPQLQTSPTSATSALPTYSHCSSSAVYLRLFPSLCRSSLSDGCDTVAAFFPILHSPKEFYQCSAFFVLSLARSA